jgi:rubrerythrin
MFSIKEILDMAIRLERNGEAVYRNAIRNISSPQLVSLLKWMADEEVKHAEWFSELKKKLEARPQNPIGEEMSRELFKDLLGEQSFSLQDTDFSQVHRINDLIAIFIEFEKDTVLFYEMLEPFIENEETLQQLKEIIAEENRHIERLKEFLENEAEVTPDNS